MVDAIVYVPPDLADDGYYAEKGQDYILRKRYGFAGVYRSWSTVTQIVRSGAASLVVYARRTHWDPVRHRVPEEASVEFADEETRPLPTGIFRNEPPAASLAAEARNAGGGLYETARLLPRGDDGGFAEKFLKDRRTRDT
jgi:hypothetical protein